MPATPPPTTLQPPFPISHSPFPTSGLDRLIAAAPHNAHLATGGMGPLVAWRLRETGQPVPEALESLPSRSAQGTVTAPWLLEQIREAIAGPMLVLKGPEVAACYPRPALRPFGDLDILVADLERAEHDLVASGFTLAGSEENVLPGYIHDRPIRFRRLPLAIELHRSPGWLSWMTPPTNEALFAGAVASATGVSGVGTLPPAEHALFLAVHSWRHGPYHSLLHLIDIDLMRRRADAAEIERIAAAWGMSNLWRRTTATIEWLLYDGPPPGRVDRYWTRHLTAWRGRTVREYYVATRSKGLAAETVSGRVRSVGSDVWGSFALRPGESRRSVARYAWRKVVGRDGPAATSMRRG